MGILGIVARRARRSGVARALVVAARELTARRRFGRGNINVPDYWDGVWRREIQRGAERDAGYSRLHARIVAQIAPADLVMDAGCGAGGLLRWVAPLLRTPPYACDFSAVAVTAVAPLCTEARVACLPVLPDAWQSRFDVIICTEVLEHLDDPLESVRALAGCLRDGGRLIASVPHRPEGEDGFFEHVSAFTAESFGALMEAAGLSVTVTIVEQPPDVEYLLAIARASELAGHNAPCASAIAAGGAPRPPVS